MSPEEIIKKVYNDPDKGCGSIRDTYKQAYAIDPSIKVSDVQEYLNKQQHRQTQFTYNKYNSFVSPHPLCEIEMDLIDLTKEAEDNDGFRYCMVAIDNFTKYAHGVPIKTKKPQDIISAFEEVLDVIGIPEQLYTDQEGSFHHVGFIQLINKHKIKRIMVIDGGHVVERFNRTLKENIQKRLDAMELERYEWVKLLGPIIDKYNNTVNRSIDMTPNNARQKGNEMLVWFNLWSHDKTDRKYPELHKGDNVKVMVKKKSDDKRLST